MHTLLEILRKSEDLLRDRGIVEARLDAEHLIADTLGCKRMELYLQFDRPMTEDLLAQIRPRLSRRARREPLSYILGHHPFHDLDLTVRPGALIPRPETEDLLQITTDHMRTEPKRILDLGTGTGAIALWLKTSFPEATVIATDRSTDALSLAKENGEKLGLEVEWTESDWFENVTSPFDLIVSNPPYLTEKEWKDAEPEVRDFEPKEALVAPDSGLADLKRILAEARPFLAEGALLALETGIHQRDSLQKTAEEAGYSEAWGEDDLNERDRFFFARA
ncbi:peptide chain release factor N(5)-glutamine methyltransferase [Puniceicoccus vermicola]|uniref:Release factor glutamine methyltransferase n=1 Tax=Puniceicoccus vermicola TaxID=388746 RepID=A0A7X1AZH2_9BACT|nr:peptide chain release factor N(5)-glutamine methyltransferase [Puniceicoccus vermicola]